MSIVINNVVLKKRLVNSKFIYMRKYLLDYLKSNRLLYLKSYLNKYLSLPSVTNDNINYLVKKSKKLAKNDFKILLLEKFSRSFIEVKIYKRQKEKAENVNSRQKEYKSKQKETKQLLQFYVDKDLYQQLELIRLSDHKSKQDFYSASIEQYASILFQIKALK